MANRLENPTEYVIVVRTTGRGQAKKRATILNGKVYSDLDEATARYEQAVEDDLTTPDAYVLVQL